MSSGKVVEGNTGALESGGSAPARVPESREEFIAELKERLPTSALEGTVDFNVLFANAKIKIIPPIVETLKEYHVDITFRRIKDAIAFINVLFFAFNVRPELADKIYVDILGGGKRIYLGIWRD